MVQIAVVVCTHNRAKILKSALESLVRQTLDKALYEIIVVDNASTDYTSQVVQEVQAMHPECNITLVREGHLGLSRARNTGFHCARGPYVSFMDDDAQANPDWLETALRCFKEIQPSPLGIGGPILPFYESPKPQWFKDEYEIRTWGDQPRFLKRGETFPGSNMILRKDVLEKFGGFDSRVGVKGEYLSLGEDTALFEKIWEATSDNSGLFYLPRLVVFHLVPAYKMAVSYRLKRAFARGQSWYILYGPRSLRRRLRVILGILVSVAKQSGLAFTQLGKYPTTENWMVEGLDPVAFGIGSLAGSIGLFIPVRQRYS